MSSSNQFSVGQEVRVVPHVQFGDLRGGATHSEMHEMTHYGYSRAIVDAIIEDDGEIAIQVYIPGQGYDVIPTRFVEPAEDPDELTTSEVASRYGLTSSAAVRMAIRRGSVKARRVGRAWVVPKKEAERYWGPKSVK